MNAPAPITDTVVHSSPTKRGITLIYEDRQAGLRGKRFSDMLATACGEVEALPLACWRSELIELPELSMEIARDAVANEFVILSFRGDAHLSFALKQWIETWLTSAANGPTCLVALFDPERSTAAHAGSIRLYLRHVTSRAGIAFFAHCAFALLEVGEVGVSEGEDSDKTLERCRSPRNGIVSFFPTKVAA